MAAADKPNNARSAILEEMGIEQWVLRSSPVSKKPAASEKAEAKPPAAQPQAVIEPAPARETDRETARETAPETETAAPPAEPPAEPTQATAAEEAAPEKTAPEKTITQHQIRAWCSNQWLVLCEAEKADKAKKLIAGLLTVLAHPPPPHQQVSLRGTDEAALVGQLSQWLTGLLSSLPAEQILLLGNPLQTDAAQAQTDSNPAALVEALSSIPNAPEVLVAADLLELLADPNKRLELWQDLQGLRLP